MHGVAAKFRACLHHRALRQSAAQRLCHQAAHIARTECPASLSAAAAPVAQRWVGRCCLEVVCAKAVAGRPSPGGRRTTERRRQGLDGQAPPARRNESALRSPAGRQRRPAQPGVQHGRAPAGFAGLRTPVNAITLDLGVHAVPKAARCSELWPRAPEHKNTSFRSCPLANAAISVANCAFCIASALRLRSHAPAPEATPIGRITSNAMSQPHVGAPRRRAAPRRQAMAHRASGQRTTELRSHSRGTSPANTLRLCCGCGTRHSECLHRSAWLQGRGLTRRCT